MQTQTQNENQVFLSREQLMAAMAEGVSLVEEKVQHLPEDFVDINMFYNDEETKTTFQLEPEGGYLPEEEADKLVGLYTHMGDWLKKSVNFPGLCDLLLETQGGCNSDEHEIGMYLWAFVATCPNPARAERRLWAVRERAAQILSRTGVMPSWTALGNALICNAATGKAAVIAAAMTLSAESPKTGKIAHFGYREARSFLIEYFSSIEKYSKEGVRHAPTPFKVVDGVEFYTALFPNKRGMGFYTGKLLRRQEDGRTYHEQDDVYDHDMAQDWLWQLECEIAHTGMTLEAYKEVRLQDYYKSMVIEAQESWEEASAA